VLAPKEKPEKELTQDQKNMRWALNKYFFNQDRHTLSVAYLYLLKEKYCDKQGELLGDHPTYNQFTYFYKKTRKLENYYITRDGLKDYQMNHRPLLGDGIQEFSPLVGTAFVDSTICDIYLLNDKKELIGRPILIVACDANCSLCLGYSLLWEGGAYSVISLMQNIIIDKVEHCRKLGIDIKREQWNIDMLPSSIVTDRGSEYVGQTLEQITELGVTLINLPSFRPDLKGSVEKLFDLVQDSYKQVLKGKGVIMPDFAKRGSHDYRFDTVLTLEDFKKIVVRSIVFYNSQRIVEKYPYTKEMLDDKVKPFASDIWNWMVANNKSNLIQVSKDTLIITLLPRTKAKFTRYGLVVNKLRYEADGFKEMFLRGGEAIVAYDSSDCSRVWLKGNDGNFVTFTLIQKRFNGMTIDEIEEISERQKQMLRDAHEESLRAKVGLIDFIEKSSDKPRVAIDIKKVRKARRGERIEKHIDWSNEINDR